MLTSVRVPDRRATERLDMALQIMTNGHKGVTVNISSTGVYFEVTTDNIYAFSPGTLVPVQIKASTTTPGFKPRDFNLMGSGSVVRNDIKRVTTQGNRLGVALEFEDRLDLQMV